MRIAHSVLISALLCGNSFAEGMCPSGYYQTTPATAQGPIGCAPIPSATQAKHSWSDRWGSIASDGKGNFGINANSASKSASVSDAIEECKARKGDGCKVVTTYKNQCAAVVASTVQSSVVNAESMEIAISNGMKNCRSKSNGEDCWVYYSGCSLPARIEG